MSLFTIWVFTVFTLLSHPVSKLSNVSSCPCGIPHPHDSLLLTPDLDSMLKDFMWLCRVSPLVVSLPQAWRQVLAVTSRLG
jgi:hypothetical protein